jgi:hypothetical protein
MIVLCSITLNLFSRDTKFSIFARVVKDVDVISYMPVFLYAQLGVTVQGNVERLVSLRDVDRAIIEPE